MCGEFGGGEAPGLAVVDNFTEAREPLGADAGLFREGLELPVGAGKPALRLVEIGDQRDVFSVGGNQTGAVGPLRAGALEGDTGVLLGGDRGDPVPHPKAAAPHNVAVDFAEKVKFPEALRLRLKLIAGAYDHLLVEAGVAGDSLM